MNDQAEQKPIIVTGLSGAGLSTVLKTLEDLGFEVFDNFPLSLVPNLIEQSDNTNALAIGIDTRTRGFSPESVLETAKNIGAMLVYITCDDRILHRRFTETRRRHPLAEDQPINVGFEKERALLTPLREAADLTIDSTAFSVHDLRHMLEGHFGSRAHKNLSISVVSFGFRNGLPREADIVIDVRFLKNPHWDKALKPKTGLDKDVGAYIETDDNFAEFIENFENLIEPLIPRYAHEGKNYLTIAIGCTGGKHRSVYCSEKVGKWLSDKGHSTHTTHRDLN